MAKKRRTGPVETKSKKEIRHQQQADTQKQTSRARILIAVGSAIILIAFLWASFGNHNAPQEWNVDDNGIMSYPIERGVPVYDSLIVDYTPEYSLENINYSSRDTVISALLRIPNSSRPVPGVLILPGATVTKEGEQGLSAELAKMGYASMVIDQRNRGGVDFLIDAALFNKGEEPFEHKMVYDALKAVDVMRQYEDIDADNITIIGISNGGRFGIIASAIDPSIKGIIGVSTSGYDVESLIAKYPDQNTENKIKFLRSIDPDTYLGKLPPRKLVMIHMTNDSVIPIEMALGTYDKANEPKVFYPVQGSGHGYNAAMRDVLVQELTLIFS
ncbi:MAG: acetylxylan esterase [ANME-2 cluster archaeon]|nr:acetylxylan esterase [ANME-2 cluster archaeon]